MKINEVIAQNGIPKTDYAWDEARCGFATLVDGEEVEFFKAKSKFDRSAANDAAKKLAQKYKVDAINADNKKREHEYQYVKPLSALEQEWAEMTNRFMSLNDKELARWQRLGEVVRKSLIDGTHPAVKK